MNKASAENLFPAQRAFPDKLFYKIGEVSRIAGIEPYVLRYWETEFPFLTPRKNKSGQRVYVKKDVEMVLQIKKLLHEERYTIEGVRKRFGDSEASSRLQITAPQPSVNDTIARIRKKLRNILNHISQ